MEQKKVRSYFFYALGEIALVMIGILLALEVNNWNEQRKEKEFEARSLVEIYNSLKTDSVRIAEWIKPRVEAKQQGVKIIGQWIESKTKYPGDSAFYEAYNLFDGRMKVSINYGPFDALKANGLDKISSPEVRYWLIDLYESLLPRQLYFIENVESKSNPVIDKLNRSLFKPVLFRDELGNFDTYNLPKSQKILEDPYFLELFKEEDKMADELVNRTRVIMDALDKSLRFLRDHFQEQEIDYKIGLANNVGIRGRLSDSTSVVNGIR